MVLEAPGRPLEPRELPSPAPGPGEVRVAVHACGVCRTDLHIVDGELQASRLPVVSGVRGDPRARDPSFPYELLWRERVLRSVANLTRQDGAELLALAPHVPVRTQVEVLPLEAANDALDRLRSGGVRGAAVLRVAP